MNVLVCGARGFLGKHIINVLEKAGHTCIRGVRKARKSNTYMQTDFVRDTAVETWLPRLKGIDVVINAVGILRDSKAQPMSAIHGRVPSALYAACAQAGVKRVVHISALGVSGLIDTTYFRTKAYAEQALEKVQGKLEYLILRPSVIYGEDGDSARMFRLLAKLPLLPLPMGGTQRMQPVHVDDVAQAIVNWLADEHARSMTVTVTGTQAVTMAQMIASYRRQMGKGKALEVPVPAFLVKFGAWCGDSIPLSPLSTETLRMLVAGSVGDNAQFSALLGRTPKSVHDFIHPENAGS